MLGTLERKALHQQVYDLFIQCMKQGKWTSGQVVSCETDLAHEFGVSIGTIRKALETAEANGFVERRKGRGTIVCKQPSWEDLCSGPAAWAVEIMGHCRPSSDPAFALELTDVDGMPVKLTRSDIARRIQSFSALLAWIDREALKPAQDDKTVTKIKVAA